MSDQAIRVHVDIAGSTRLVGRLWVRVSRGRETASFEYDPSWLRDPDSFSLEPALPARQRSTWLQWHHISTEHITLLY